MRDAVESLIRDDRIVAEEYEGQDGETRTALYLTRYHRYETGIAKYLRKVLHSPKSVGFEDPDGLLRKVAAGLPIALAEEQMEAAAASLRDRCW